MRSAGLPWPKEGSSSRIWICSRPYIFAYTGSVAFRFPNVERKQFVVTCKRCRREVPAGVPAFLRTEKSFRRIMGYRELWTLEAILSESQSPLNRQWRSNINPTAVGNFQLRAGHPRRCLGIEFRAGERRDGK
jgi:hypothetical protein